MIHRDIAVLIPSRGRAAVAGRLLDDLERAFLPALQAGGLSVTVALYAQGYAPEVLAGWAARHAALVAAGDLLILPAERPHARIGDVVHAATALLHERVAYRLAML